LGRWLTPLFARIDIEQVEQNYPKYIAADGYSFAAASYRSSTATSAKPDHSSSRSANTRIASAMKRASFGCLGSCAANAFFHSKLVYPSPSPA
jgi:hypothetical protein